MIHPLILGNLKEDPTRIVRTGLLAAIETSVLLAWIAVVNASFVTRGQANIGHWLSNLLGIVFWISFAVVVLVKHVDVAERSRDFGILRILGAPETYFVGFLLQEAFVESVPGALLGLVLGYIATELFGVLLGASMSTPFQWWPVATAIVILASLVGAISAIPRAIREGVAEALQ